MKWGRESTLPQKGTYKVKHNKSQIPLLISEFATTNELAKRIPMERKKKEKEC